MESPRTYMYMRIQKKKKRKKQKKEITSSESGAEPRKRRAPKSPARNLLCAPHSAPSITADPATGVRPMRRVACGRCRTGGSPRDTWTMRFFPARAQNRGNPRSRMAPTVAGSKPLNRKPVRRTGADVGSPENWEPSGTAPLLCGLIAHYVPVTLLLSLFSL